MIKSASLLDKQSMGGLYGEGGYKFQDAYIVSKIPDWICDINFIQILKEGSGDVDIAYKKDGQLFRIYTQIKDHAVTPAEFRDVLKQFKDKDTASPGTYQRFVLACIGLSDDVKKLKTALDRIRGIKDYFTPQDQITNDTLTSLSAITESLQLNTDTNFILEKIYFEDDWPGLTELEQTIRLFCGGMLNVKNYQEKTRIFRHLFHPLYTYIVDSSGKTISKSDLEAKISEFIENYKHQIEQEGFTLRIYHWEDTPYEINLTLHEVLNWSGYFERKTRKIALPTVWQGELLPQLSDLQKRIRASGTIRLIRLEGSACLSAGIALGYTFPEVAEYIIEIHPRLGQKIVPWRTDILQQKTYRLNSQENHIRVDGKDLAVKFNIVADVTNDLERYISETGTQFKIILELTPENGIGEIISNESAIGYARDAKRLIREVTNKYGINKIHLFFAGPLGLAIFFGQLLNSMPEIQCYEQRYDGGYQLSCLIPKT